MARELQLRGGTSSEHESFTGKSREVTIDTDKNTIIVHDNKKAGGYAMAKAADSLAGYGIADAYTKEKAKATFTAKFVQDTVPDNANVGDLWADTSDNIISVAVEIDGSIEWVEV